MPRTSTAHRAPGFGLYGWGVSFQNRAANRKLSPVRVIPRPGRMPSMVAAGPFYVASTYTSIEATCPDSCQFKRSGCYVREGAPTVMRPLDEAARGYPALQVTEIEAQILAEAWPTGVPQDGRRGGRDLRLHVGGDVSCSTGTRLLAGAVEGLQGRGLGSAWTYTHRWARISRRAWGPISVLASVDSIEQAIRAIGGGYVPAIVVREFPSPKRIADHRLPGGWSWIPCPYEASPRRPTCAECRLCLDAEGLAQRRTGILFRGHGRRLPVLP